MAVELLTYDDCVQHLTDTFDFVSTNTTKLGRLARIAIDSVYRDFPYKINWRYYQRRTTFETVSEYATGTIAYDHTGGSSERLITLSSGTFPSWTQFGRIIIDDVAYRIATNPSSTTATLYEEDNPGEDIASGETYTLYRSEYPLPADFRRNIKLYDTTDEIEIPIIEFAESQHLQIGVDKEPDIPRCAYIRNTGDYLGVWSVEFMPPPSAARTYDLSYEAKPRDILTVSYSTGTVSTSSTAVTGSGTTFPALCVGSVIRFGVSASGTAVSNKFGSNPFTEQRIITARGSATGLTIDQAPTSAYSAGTAYQISDPIDIHPGAMTTAFLRHIEAEFAKLLNTKDIASRIQLASHATFQAMENEPSNVYANTVFAHKPQITWTDGA